MRASSWNQISMGLPGGRSTKWAFSVAEKFFELRHDALILSRMARAGADVRKADPVQDLAHGALVVDDTEALSDEVLQVDPAPTHDPVHGPIRSGLDEAGEFSLLLGAEAGRVALGPNVLQPLGSVLVEAMDPVSQGLAIHAADAGGLCPVHPVQDRGEGQQASALVGVLRYGRKPAKLTGRKIRPHCHGCWHGADPPRTMEADQTQSGNPRESASKAAGMTCP